MRSSSDAAVELSTKKSSAPSSCWRAPSAQRSGKKCVIFNLNKSFCGVSHSGDGPKRGPLQ